MTSITCFAYRGFCCAIGCVIMAIVLQASAAQAGFVYTETWATTGSQAAVDGQTFGNYPEWTFSEASSTTSNVRVDAAGVLTLAKSNVANTLGAVITPTSIGVSSPFDVSSFPLTLTVEAARGFNPNGSPSNSNVGAFIGDVVFLFHPGLVTGGGVHRIQRLDANLTANATLLNNVDLGFAPGTDNAGANTGFTELVITISEKDIDEYTFDYSITDLVDGDVYLNSIDILKTNVGPLDRAGVRFNGGADSADALFRNFSIMQAPEPASIALWSIMGAFGLAYVVWRRRRFTS